MRRELFIRAARVAGIYAAVATVWIVFSDRATALLFSTMADYEAASTVKGCAFVAVTAILLFALFRRELSAHRAELEKRFLSQKWLKMMTEHTKDIVFFKDREGRYLFANRAAEEMPAVPVGDMIGLDNRQLFPPEEARAMMERDRRVLETGQIETYEQTLTDSKGQQRHLLATKGPLHDASNEIIGTFGIMRDITERQDAEAKLRESESLLRAIAENSTDVIFVKDRECRFVFMNPAGYRFNGTTPEKLLGRSKADFHPNSDEAAQFNADDLRVMESRREEIIEESISAADGTRHVFLTTKAPRFNDQGQVIGLIGIAHDITERKLAEDALRESEGMYRSLFENMLNGFAYCRMIFEDGQPVDFTYLKVNENFAKLTGLKNVEGKNVSEAIPGLREADPKLLEIYGRVAMTGQPERFETYVEALKDWYSISVYCPQREYFVAVFDVVTERKAAEQKLRENEELLKMAMAASHMGAFRWNVQTNKITYSPESLAILDLAPFEDSFEAVARLLHPEDSLRVMAAMNSALANGTEFHEEFRIIRQDGKLRWLSHWARATNDAAGQPLAVSGTIMDITAHKEAELALEDKNELLREVSEAAHIGGWSFDVATRAGSWTDEIARIHDLDPCIVPNVDFGLEFYPGESRTRMESAVKAAIESGTPFDLELELVSARGIHKWVRSIGIPVRQDGRVVRVRGAMQDITRSKHAEEDSSRLATIVEQAAECIVITDANGIIQYVNPAFERVTGYHRSEVAGQNPRVLKSGRQDAGYYRQMWQVLSRGEVWKGHFINKRKDGTLYEEEATISPVRDPAGRIAGYVAIKRDVTEHVMLQAHTEKLQAQFLQAQKMATIGRLAAGVAHDFNNLLLAILGYSEILLDEIPPDTTQHADVLEIQKTGKRAAELTKQLLALGRKQNLDQRLTDVNVLIEDLNKMLHRVIGEDISIEFNLAPDLDRVMADHGQIGQVLLNLAVNARDAMPRGGRLVFSTSARTFAEDDLALHPGVGPGHFVSISATDTGTGMSREVLGKLFEPFFTTKDPGKGTGLGLATSYGIARQHGGWLDVYSEPGQGSTFRLYLPIVERTAGSSEIIAAAKPAPVAELKGAGQHILFVEDEETIRTMIQRQLERSNYRVIVAADAGEARELFDLAGGKFDLVLTDVILPDRSGIELLDELLAKKPDLRVLVSSGYTDNEKRWPVILERKWPFIGKPYSITDLLEAVHRVFAAAR